MASSGSGGMQEKETFTDESPAKDHSAELPVTELCCLCEREPSTLDCEQCKDLFCEACSSIVHVGAMR